MKIGLVSCTKKKKPFFCEAEKLYSESPLFRYALKYCKRHYDKVYILSAKYGIVGLHQKIKPYDLTLKTMKKKQRKNWAEKVANELKEKIKKDDVLFFHAGKYYREFLVPLLGNRTKVPLRHLSFGKQLSFYKNKIKNLM